MNDQLTPNKSIYEASYKDVILKNFLAGLSRAIGGVFISLIFWGIAIYSFVTYAWPKIEPFVNEYLKAVETINQLQGKTIVPGETSATQQYQQFLQDLNSSFSR